MAREGVLGARRRRSCRRLPGSALWLARLFERARRRASARERLAAALDRLGPSYVKLGQFLATRPDVVGAEHRARPGALQDRMQPFPQAEAVAASRGRARPAARACSRRFGEPVAAASIAQVHRADVATPTASAPSRSRCCGRACAALSRAISTALSFAARNFERFARARAAAAGRDHRDAGPHRHASRWTCGWRPRPFRRWPRTRATIRASACPPSTGNAPPATC